MRIWLYLLCWSDKTLYSLYNRPFAGSGHMVRNKLCLDANNTVGLSKQRKVGLDWYEFLCFGSRTALFASQCNLFCTMWLERGSPITLWMFPTVLHLFLYSLTIAFCQWALTLLNQRIKTSSQWHQTSFQVKCLIDVATLILMLISLKVYTAFAHAYVYSYAYASVNWALELTAASHLMFRWRYTKGRSALNPGKVPFSYPLIPWMVGSFAV